MKCEECLPLIEEYVDGELDGRIIERLDAHLSSCAACAAELDALRREQEVYASYRRDIEVTPGHWNIVRARIEQEKEAAPQAESRPRFGGWLGGLFGKRLRPAFGVAVVMAAVTITAAVVYLRPRDQQKGLAFQGPKALGPIEWRVPGEVNGNKDTVARNGNEEKRGDEERPRVTASNGAGTGSSRRTQTLARVPRRERQIVGRPTPEGPARFEEAAAYNAAPGVGVSAPEAAGEFDFEMARHAGRAELLLRSFRNVRPVATAARSLDVSFEKEQSHKLLYRNIALRRAAEERGDSSALRLLNTLEPILLDIANLPGRVRARDVESIERRMEKKEIVAALQVRTLLASN
ncbi:MAG TPA: zf-HC2 domain-containing protein [Pyrinomonadaceae bacterium]|nr:zf-HC2 domain-containing protein [Pyrinomonadaceae bacterium]